MTQQTSGVTEVIVRQRSLALLDHTTFHTGSTTVETTARSAVPLRFTAQGISARSGKCGEFTAAHGRQVLLMDAATGSRNSVHDLRHNPDEVDLTCTP